MLQSQLPDAALTLKEYLDGCQVPRPGMSEDIMVTFEPHEWYHWQVEPPPETSKKITPMDAYVTLCYDVELHDERPMKK